MYPVKESFKTEISDQKSLENKVEMKVQGEKLLKPQKNQKLHIKGVRKTGKSSWIFFNCGNDQKTDIITVIT